MGEGVSGDWRDGVIQYHKIQTAFKRDPATNYRTLMTEWALPEFRYLSDLEWVFTEKVDGTNIRVMFTDGTVAFGGKTDRATLPLPLLRHLQETFTPERMTAQFPNGNGICLYGEGCGAKIQKGGGNYYRDQRFVLFDVRVGDMWLRREAVAFIAADLDIPIVPEIGRGNLWAMSARCRDGFTSTWGDFRAEGIVARPAVELIDRRGNRVITKLKCKDFGGTS
jgi:hypothetical protein